MNVSFTADDILAAAAVLTPIGGGVIGYIGFLNTKVGKAWEAIDKLKEKQTLCWTREDHEKFRLEIAADQKAMTLEIKEDFKALSLEIKELRAHIDDSMRKIMQQGG